MKILYAIQGTGNGHICRAKEIIPLLQLNHDVDVLVSGTQADVHLGHDVKYSFNGLSFIFGKKGGVDLLDTYKKSRLRKLFKEINELPVEEYDLILNDFEPVSAWAAYIKRKPCIALSHQAAVLHPAAPQPKAFDPVGKAILKSYAPSTAQYGFHFTPYDRHIFTPVVRNDVRQLPVENQGHYTVYLPAYDDKRILKVLKKVKHVQWQVFSKHNKKPVEDGNVIIKPIENGSFLQSMASSEGVLCGAGFETPAEALYLQKKLMVIPMKNQYEQQCNAAALEKMGVPVIKSLKDKHLPAIMDWIENGSVVLVNYADNTKEILNIILQKHANDAVAKKLGKDSRLAYFRDFRKLAVKRLMKQLQMR
ncbi:glycosyltransferase family protein [Aridibaculum aurantiacum]|uniref:glycosyltransferase family protein n=1 Tax=Aridibaculum aurantiacum TaxID=2810307 RepID=UPI001A974A85|nr:glycosyltransferase family protein [Aridibaculum aurantiacum]